MIQECALIWAQFIKKNKTSIEKPVAEYKRSLIQLALNYEEKSALPQHLEDPESMEIQTSSELPSQITYSTTSNNANMKSTDIPQIVTLDANSTLLNKIK